VDAVLDARLLDPTAVFNTQLTATALGTAKDAA